MTTTNGEPHWWNRGDNVKIWEIIAISVPIFIFTLILVNLTVHLTDEPMTPAASHTFGFLTGFIMMGRLWLEDWNGGGQ